MIFLIIILIFMFMFVSFFVLFAYLYAYVLFGVLSFSKRLSVRIGFLVFYAIFTLLILYFGFGATLVLVVPVIILFILILKRKQCFTKLKLTMASAGLLIASAGLLVIAWQLEVPQKIIINMFDDKIEIFDNNYTVLENNNKSNIVSKFENDGYLPQISLFEIYFRTREIYIYDDINKTINERKIAEIKTPFIAESTLMCFLRNIETGGKCTGFTHGPKYKVNGKNFTLNELLKQYQKGEKQ